MKKILVFVLLVFCTSSLSAVDIWTLDFESASGYTTSIPEFTDGYTDYWLRTDGSDISTSAVYNGVIGTYYFAGMDLDGEGATLPLFIDIDDIDISGQTNIEFKIYLAEDDDAANQDWDPEDYLHIGYDIDNTGSFTPLLWIESEISTGYNGAPKIDTDFDGVGDGTEITDTFVQFTVSIPGTGSLLDLQLEYYLNSGDEDIAIDHLQLFAAGGNNPPVIVNVVTDPLAPTSSNTVDVSADITDSDGTITSAKLMWGTDGSTFPNTINMTTSRATYTIVSSIPAQTQGTTVYYKIEAIDDEPDTTTTGAYSYKIPYELSIYAIQGGISASPYDGDEVITDGIVTGVYSSAGFFTIQDSSATWNGIWVKDATAVSRGDDVTIRGTVAEDYSYGDTNNTILKNVTVTINSSGNALPAVLTINTEDVPTEEYEGVLIKVSNAECTNEDLGYGEWEVNDGSGACRANDLGYAYTPVLGTSYDVTGPLAYSYSDFKIEPRELNDIVDLGDTNPPEIANVVAPNSSTVQVTFSEYVDETTSGNTANYSISSRLVTVNNAVRNSPDSTRVTLTVSGMTEGDYTLTVINVEDLHENAIISESMNFSYTAPPETGDVVINEIGEPYDMSGTWQDSYIELYNNTEDDIDISNWIIHSIQAKGRATSSFTFPEGTIIQADSFIVATRERDNFLADYGTYVDNSIVPIASATTGTGVYIANGYYFSLETDIGTTLESTSSTVSWNSEVYERANPDSAANNDDNWYLTYQSEPVQGTPGHTNSHAQPNPPQNVTIQINGNDVVLTWAPGSAKTTYNVYRCIDPYGTFVKINTSPVTETTYNDYGAASAETKYFYYITEE